MLTYNDQYLNALKLLSPSEIKVLDLVEKGHLNKEVAKELQISEFTVRTHRQNICKKLNICGANGLVKWLWKVKNHVNEDT